jgi:hypothetical protein
LVLHDELHRAARGQHPHPYRRSAEGPQPIGVQIAGGAGAKTLIVDAMQAIEASKVPP